MRTLKLASGIIAALAFALVISPLAIFVYSSIEGNVGFGFYFTQGQGEVEITFQAVNNESIGLRSVRATMNVSVDGNVTTLTFDVGDLGPWERGSSTAFVSFTREFRILDVEIEFVVAGLYPMKVVQYGG